MGKLLMAGAEGNVDEPEPEVISCFFDASFVPALAAMQVRWPEQAERVWRLPAGLTVRGPAPERFGIRLSRVAAGQYAVCLLWDQLGVRLPCVGAADLLDSSLDEVLRALGTDLRWMLDPPVEAAPPFLLAAA